MADENLHRHERAGADVRTPTTFPASAGGTCHRAYRTRGFERHPPGVRGNRGPTRWQQVERLLAAVFQVHANILFIDPCFRFQVIATDPDDNKFVDCAVAAQADFIVTADTDFKALVTAGYKPKPVSPEEFIQQYL